MLEKTKSSEREVHYSRQNNESHYPVSEVIEYSEAWADEELNEVITGPRDNIANGKACGWGEASTRGCDQITHTFFCYCW